MPMPFQKAMLWESVEQQAVRCNLCHFKCLIKPGQLGQCRVRQNLDGVLYSLNYHRICAVHVDPIEKKPLFHFQPGQKSFSLAAVGCNFQCDFCQNWRISQVPRLQQKVGGESYRPDDLVTAAHRHRCASMSYTYTEPTIFMELCQDCGRLARQRGIANVLVSNGFLSPEAIDLAGEWLDAINVDLKAFTDDFYRQNCKARLEPVLQSLRHIARNTDIWVEITTLVIPGLNDSDEEFRHIADFVVNDLGPYVPWHISRFHPDYERTQTSGTSPETLERAYHIGRQAGLRYVYVGNLPGSGWESTYCHTCGKLLIERVGYTISHVHLVEGCCDGCKTPMAGRKLDSRK